MKKKTKHKLRRLIYTIQGYIGALSFFALLIASCTTLLRDVPPGEHQLTHLPMAIIFFALAVLLIKTDNSPPEYQEEEDEDDE